MKKDWKKSGRDSGSHPRARPGQAEARRAESRHPESRHAESRNGEPRHGEPRHKEARPSDTAFRRPAAELAILYGTHPVREALRMKRRKLLTLFATEAAAARLAGDIAASGVALQIVDGARLDQRLGRDAVHQGLLLEARPLPALDIADVAGDGGTLLVLDQITDPHNVGAILRTAAAFAVRGLVMTDRHPPALDGVLAKSASGALEHVPIASVVNLARALDEIGELGFRRIGLDSDGGADLRGDRGLRSPSRLCSARKAAACGASRASVATSSPGFRCPARSAASMSRTPARSRSRRSVKPVSTRRRFHPN